MAKDRDISHQGKGKPNGPSAQTATRTIVHSVEAKFSGPLPPPGLLAEYEKVSPGFADRIVKLAEGEAQHRRNIENTLVNLEVQEQQDRSDEVKRGQLCGLTIGIVALLAGSYVAAKGYGWAGATIGGVPVVGLVTAFIVGRKSSPDDSDDDTEEDASTGPAPRKNNP